MFTSKSKRSIKKSWMKKTPCWKAKLGNCKKFNNSLKRLPIELKRKEKV